MKTRTSARIIRIAIAVSLAAHLVFAAFVHSHPVIAASSQGPQPVQIFKITLPKRTPTPPPAKPQAPQPRSLDSRVHAPVVKPPHISTSAKTGPGLVAVSPVPGTPGPGPQETGPPAAGIATQAPSPSPTPKPACNAPDIAAKAVEAVTPQAPPDAAGVQAQTRVKVDLDASGAVTGAEIYRTSGNQQLDRAAVEAAKASRYAPEERNCKSVPGSYLFTVDFQE